MAAAPWWPPKHIKGLDPIPRIEALTYDVTGLQGPWGNCFGGRLLGVVVHLAGAVDIRFGRVEGGVLEIAVVGLVNVVALTVGS